MKFSYEEPHVWYQFALSLIETGKVKTLYLHEQTYHRSIISPKSSMLLEDDTNCELKFKQMVLGFFRSDADVYQCDGYKDL